MKKPEKTPVEKTAQPGAAGENKEPVKEPVGSQSSAAAQPEKNVYDPLIDQTVIEKSYTGAGAGAGFTKEQLMEDIPEFTPSTPPPAADILDDSSLGGGNGGTSASSGGKEKKEKKEPFNPDFKDLSDTEQSDAAAKMARGILQGYKFLNLQGERFLKIGEKKINKLQMNGDVDLSITVPWSMTEMISLGEFFKAYNEQCDGIFVVEPEFEKEVMPPLTRVLAKRGHGWSDEHFLMFMFGQDILKKGMQFTEIKGTLNQVLQFAKDQTASARSGLAHQPPPPPPQQQAASSHHQAPPPPPQQAQQEEKRQTLQQVAIDKHVHNKAKTADGMPRFGGNRIRKLNKVSKEMDKQQADAKTVASAIIKNSKDKVRQMAPVVPDGKKRGKGRPPGSKNRPKLPR